MIMHMKLKEESSRVLSALLVSALEACRQGDVELAENLGLSIETLQQLDQLKADQIAHLCGHYMRDASSQEVFHINPDKMSRMIALAVDEAMQSDMIDEYLRRGACKTMMLELFGMRSTQVANRKKFLKLPTVKGRLPMPSIDQQRKIYATWLASSDISEYRERLLSVARKTALPLSRIYREVQEIESVVNPSSSTG